ncbi:YDG domain-containing protein [Sphingomonas canadensis]|uniref:beta strand repeat-containing protein n=1 Tax=Sphingomonas canadensis TaxID=1219257 RepID=UPI00222E42A2|nr:YDG domain-containing protein [Sphingomonas canadensis]MCW3836502.1 YDG domain-containing protein [Sphingomonas canadensis]
MTDSFVAQGTSVTINGVSVNEGGITVRSSAATTLARGLVASGDILVETGSGDLVIAADGSVTGANVVLSTPAAFINNAGANAVTASGRWVIYSANPTGNTFGGLDSGNTAYWNSTLATRAPGTISGNRYVFAYQPTATINAIDFNKIYGTDLNAPGAAIPFGATGLHPGVTGAFLGDTVSTAFTGSPAITSAGFAPRASVAGGPYSQTLTGLGTLTSPSGYAIQLGSSAGMVTVTPKALTATVAADDKTYDGTVNATGSVVLTGVVDGDSVGTSSGSFAFADKNAGTDKTVTVSGITLTGADSGNYTLSVPATVLADIFKKALNLSYTVNSKTYDGTTGATGTVTFNGGVIQGDQVQVTGASFAFADKNAGAGKAVNVTGITLTGADAGNYTFSIPGSLVADILKKAITGTATANNKTYDGATGGTGSVVLNGVVQGDAVGTNGTVFTFADKNAGTGKTVSVSGTTLTGADAGNYTLTVPASVLADILKKAITGTATANNKTYDGATGGTGSVVLNGVVQGDAVGTSGTVFTFADKNAGTGKTVSVSGTTLTGADAGNYTLTVPASVLADILKKAITGTATTNNKTYDGTTGATGNVVLNGVVQGDQVGTAGTVFAFADKNAGAGKTVNVSGTTLTGADAGNYTLSIPATVLADILKKAITGTATANNKTYDGTTGGTGNVVLNGVVQGDSVTGSATFTFSDKNAGTGKAVSISEATLSGADAGNYTLTLPASALADILKKALTATVTADDKTYDGTNGGTGSVALNGVVQGDAVGTSGTVFTFADKNAGNDKTVSVSGTTLTGADAGNYTLTVPASVLADILKKALSASFTAENKTYDGNTSATGTATITGGVVQGDQVTLTGATFAFADKNAGTGKTVNLAGVTLTGADAGNYAVAPPTTLVADIFKKALSGTVTANSKIYDGTTSGTGTVTLSGVVQGDSVAGSAVFTFSDKNAGTGKTVTVSGAALTGADAGNYTIALPSSALADILKKALTATVTINARAYDGTTSASGSVALNGVVQGDQVGTSGSIFAFADKNAGTGKAVAVSGTVLTGADAGNYTLSVPASALGNILKRSLTVSTGEITKDQGQPDPALTFTITNGSLVSGDALSGALARAPGELPGNYAILLGTLTAGSNYEISIGQGSVFVILARLSDNAGEINSLKVVTLPAQIQDIGTPSAGVTIDEDAPCGADENCTAGS